MQINETLQVLSECGLGAIVANDDSTIVEANPAALTLLHDDMLVGKALTDVAPCLWQDDACNLYTSPAFGVYLLRCPTPQVDGLSENAKLIIFRDATRDACHDMLVQVLGQVSESVILFDHQERIYMLNDAAEHMDSIVTDDVRGEIDANVYIPKAGSKLAIPEVLRTRQAILNLQQQYTTRYGKEVHVITDLYPIVQNGQVLGAFNVMKDWSMIERLQKKIMDLQQKLVDQQMPTAAKNKSGLTAKYQFRDIIHVSGTMHELVAQCRQVAKNDSSVMLYGETGTGKELLAQSIHNASRRADGPFLAINCAALPENLLEGILFGTEKGAYTGAERRPGLLEQADGGTLLLDELNSMDISLQAKLLRVLQDGVVRRVGGMSEKSVDVRFLSNLNIPPYQAIAEGKLRQDLFYRLGVVNFTIPPLRQRKEDIPLLAKSFIATYNKKLLKNVRNIDAETLQVFMSYDWPGNVRELQHCIEHAMNVLPDAMSTITVDYVPAHIRSIQPQKETARECVQTTPELGSMLRGMERQGVENALRQTGGNISQAAKLLGLSRQNLQYRIRRYQLDPTDYSQE